MKYWKAMNNEKLFIFLSIILYEIINDKYILTLNKLPQDTYNLQELFRNKSMNEYMRMLDWSLTNWLPPTKMLANQSDSPSLSSRSLEWPFSKIFNRFQDMTENMQNVNKILSTWRKLLILWYFGIFQRKFYERDLS